MNEFISNLKAYTIFQGKEESRQHYSPLFFLLSALIIGAVAAVIYGVATFFFSSVVSALLALSVELVLLGGFSLSGFIETSSYANERRIIGRETARAMAVVFAVILFIINVYLVASLADYDAFGVIIAFPLLVRWALVAVRFKKGDAFAGTRYSFAVSNKDFFLLTLATLIVLALLLSWYGVVVAILVFLVADGIYHAVEKKEPVAKYAPDTAIELSQTIGFVLTYILFALF